jgi:cytochrome c biogenesis protein CcmG/thiol:disulfide interchange protein DsbE
MAEEIDTAQQERQKAQAERQEFKAELAAYAASLPRRPRNRRRMVTLIAIAGALVLAGLVSLLTLLPSATPASIGVPVGTAAPAFNLPIYGGGGSGMVDLHALRGRPVLINFWSESCPPCRVEMPYLERTYTQAHGEFALLGIDQADPKDDIAPFGRAYHITYPLLFDPGGTVNAAYSVTAIPTTYFLDSQGIVRAVFVTQLSPKTMQQGLASVGIRMP